ncbi:MAG: hypothetical protein U1E69_08525 [Tabrizicola sp.]|jgi:hypothetical protein|uniref:hypothetical protein n=1 Tax=Tabrizicola sp. TaxID=2005166 RepID=UPI002ABBD4F1|nr:hypothetical protein [Tabrizicola sp.]MDZ4086834.1 hypothetical protein [Tabrizicola sp.]
MFDGGIVPFLSLFTLLAVGVLALISKERTKDRMRDPNAPVSTLAKDGKYGGVAFLLPLEDRLRVVRRMELARVPVAEVRRQMLRRDEP